MKNQYLLILILILVIFVIVFLATYKNEVNTNSNNKEITAELPDESEENNLPE